MISSAVVAAAALTSVACAGSRAIVAQAVPQTIRLWPGTAPGAVGTADEDVPTLTVYLPSPGDANGAGMVVCPGGGYTGLASHEAGPPAEWLSSAGCAAFVLKYRLAPRYRYPIMLEDVARAVRMVRAHASEWGLDPHRIGILGFSAGGHLASTIATHFAAGNPASPDAVERVSSRPDLAVLVYPVITMTAPYTHQGSRNSLLGEHPARSLIVSLSNETQVTHDTPPCFLVASAEDSVVPCINSLVFAVALRKAGVPFELHVYEHGAHGFGMGQGQVGVSSWPGLCVRWLRQRGFLVKH